MRDDTERCTMRTLYHRISMGGHLPRRVEWMGVRYVNPDPAPDETWEVDEDYEGGHPPWEVMSGHDASDDEPGTEDVDGPAREPTESVDHEYPRPARPALVEVEDAGDAEDGTRDD